MAIWKCLNIFKIRFILPKKNQFTFSYEYFHFAPYLAVIYDYFLAVRRVISFKLN